MNIKRVVLDTNILVSALLSREGNPAKIYRMFVANTLTVVYCEEILEEYQDVLYRPRLNIPMGDADIVMTAIQDYGEKVTVEPGSEYMVDEDNRIFYKVGGEHPWNSSQR
jgi:putative PIN family toxin of toxin-antitoxin system